MLTKAHIKLVQLLQQKKYREEQQLFTAEGVKIIADFINSDLECTHIFANADWFRVNKTSVPMSVSLIQVTDDELKRMTKLSTPNKVIGVFKIPAIKPTSNKENVTLVLDGINDPGNLGTIIRIADWYGINAIVCSDETVDCYNYKVVQATMGSLARVNITYANLVEYLKNSTVKNIYGTTLDGENIYKQTLQLPALLVMGSESHGISDEVQECLTQKIKIPSNNKNEQHAESLNVGVATAVACSEFLRSTIN
jgi:RNA methyltransferase, TrmH family